MIAQGTHPIYQAFAEALDLVEAKAHDYAEDDNVFSNFEFAAQVAGVTTEQVFAVLLGVKVARLGQLIGNDKLPNFESIGDTLLDTMNYAGLLKAYMEQEAEITTIREAYETAEMDAEDALAIQVGEETAWDKYKRETEARWKAGLTHSPQEIVSRPDGIVLNSVIKPGSIVRLVVPEGEQDHRSEFEYRVTLVDDRLKKVEGVPTKEWSETLGDKVRQFTLEQIELV